VEKISLLVIQPTAFCNIDCRYCYLHGRSDPARMDMDVLEQVFAKVFASPFVGDVLRVCWHAGEPTVVPVSFYRTAFARIESLRPAAVRVEHQFQTNATLINDEWCDLFREHRAGVGVSIDGPRFIHDHARVNRTGKGTHELTMRGIRHLQAREVRFDVICVLTRQSLRHPDEIFDFFVENRIANVCFNVEEQEGANVAASTSEEDTDALFVSFFRRYYLRLQDAGFPHWVREIDKCIHAVLGADLQAPQNALTTPMRSVAIDRLGNFSTFCPELLGVETRQYGPLLFGNLTEVSVEECLGNARLQQVAADIAEGVRMCRETCSYFGVCGGGTPANKWFENGTFASTETRFCRLSVKALTDLALEWVEAGVTRGAQPDSARSPARASLA
jgi:uncharacterized protein